MSSPRLDRIALDPQIMFGKPVIRGTRITVEILLEKLAAGSSVDQILEDYPQLQREDVQAALEYARRAISTEDVIPLVASA